ncbi:alpha/beta fold hydrolase [Devosia sp. XGJD_8]|uniref:alpha/beta fold hydrolase n=1 Tax=Devosia sp. XGJD_8 TaxID=3391187 RepID=UPI003984942A
MANLADVISPNIANLTLDDSIGAMAERALAMAPDEFVLVSLSMGGYVALEIMRRAPKRVKALALFSTSAAPDTPERAARRRDAMASLQQGRFVGVTNRILKTLVDPSHSKGPVAQSLKAMAGRVGGEAFLRQQQAILDRVDSRPLLPYINVPTLVVVGENDVLTPPSDALEIHLGVRRSSFLVMRNCGHLPVLERPQEATFVLRRWLCDLGV